MAQTHIRKTGTTGNDPAGMQEKSIHRQHNYHIQNIIRTDICLRNTLLDTASTSNILECFQSEVQPTLVHTDYDYLKGSLTPRTREQISGCNFNAALTSAIIQTALC